MDKNGSKPQTNCPSWVRNMRGGTLMVVVVVGCCIFWGSVLGIAVF